MLERYEGVAGNPIVLYLYVRDESGAQKPTHSVGYVYIYEEDPIENWDRNVLVRSTLGVVPNAGNINVLTDTTVNYIDKNVNPGDFVYVRDGNNSGYYNISNVSEHKITINGFFYESTMTLSYEIVKLRAILFPQYVSDGVYKVEWEVPAELPGGFYFDYWTDIKETPTSAPYDVVKKLYIENTNPVFNSTSETMTDRYTARQGSYVLLDMTFASNSPVPVSDPASIKSVQLYRYDPSGGVAPAIESTTGVVEPGNLYAITDASVNFNGATMPIRKYDTLYIKSPEIVSGYYRINYVENDNKIVLLDMIGGSATDIEYEIHYMYYLDSSSIYKLSDGKFGIEVLLPSDIDEGSYWDKWIYSPTFGEESKTFSVAYEDETSFIFDNTKIEVDPTEKVAKLILDGATSKYPTTKPSIYSNTDLILSNPKYLTRVSELLGIVHDGTVEYTISQNDTELFYNGNEWIENTGRMIEGFDLWKKLLSGWSFDNSITDIKGVNNGTKYGSGIGFVSDSGYYNQVSLEFDNKPFSFSFAFKTASIDNRVIAMKAVKATGNGGPGWVIGIDNGILYIRLSVSNGMNGTPFTYDINGVTARNDNQWHYCTISIFNSDSANNVKIYIDGELESEGVGPSAEYITSENPLIIGADYNDGQGEDLFFDGNLQEFMIYKGVALELVDHLQLFADAINNTHTNTLEEINNNMKTLNVLNGDHIRLKAYLVSDGDKQIEVAHNGVEYIEYTESYDEVVIGEVKIHSKTYQASPGPLDLCTITGRLLDITGFPVVNVPVIFYTKQAPEFIGANVITATSTLVTTNVGGYFSLTVPQGVTGWISIPSVGLKEKVVIPNKTNIGFEALVTGHKFSDEESN